MTQQTLFTGQGVYQIRLKGCLNVNEAPWLQEFTISTQHDQEVLLVGPVANRPALHRILSQIHSYGLSLLSVRLIAC